MLYPKNGLAMMLRQQADRGADVLSLLRQVTGDELRGEGRVYGGGLNKIEPNELARISAVSFVQRWPQLGSAVQRQEKLFRLDWSTSRLSAGKMFGSTSWFYPSHIRTHIFQYVDP